MPTSNSRLRALVAGGVIALAGPIAGAQARTTALPAVRCAGISVQLGAGATAQFTGVTVRGVTCKAADALLSQYASAGSGSRINGFACRARTTGQQSGLARSSGSCVSGRRVVVFSETAPPL